MRGWVFFCFSLASLAFAQDPYACSAYIRLIELQDARLSAQVQAEASASKPDEWAFWMKEVQHLEQDLRTLNQTLFATISPPGAVRNLAAAPRYDQLPAVPSVLVDSVDSLRPQEADEVKAGDLVFSPSGTLLLVLPMGGTRSILWDLEKPSYRVLRREKAILNGFFDWNSNVTLLDNGGKLHRHFTAQADPNKIPNWKVRGIAYSGSLVGFMSTGGVRPGKNGLLHFSKPNTYERQFTHSVKIHRQSEALALSPDGQIAAVIHDGQLMLLDIPGDRAIATVNGFVSDVTARLAFDPLARYLVALDVGGGISVWSRADQKIFRWTLTGLEPRAIALDTQGRLFVGGQTLGGMEGAIAVIDIEQGQEIQRLRPELDGAVEAMAFGPKQAFLVVGGSGCKSLHFLETPP